MSLLQSKAVEQQVLDLFRSENIDRMQTVKAVKRETHRPPPPCPTITAEAARGSEAWFLQLRRCLGADAWAERVEEARLRELHVLYVIGLNAYGLSLSAAMTEVAKRCGISANNLYRWHGRYRELGIRGLINRTGNVRSVSATSSVTSSAKTSEQPRRRAYQNTLSFLKWAGSKKSVMTEILAAFPLKFGRYFEPMVGSGTIFFSLQPATAVLNDVNTELMDCYIAIRDHVEQLIAGLQEQPNTEEHYFSVRALNPATLTLIERAVRFIYLNKTCYNGLYRLNAAGRFNVPYGKNSHVLICNPTALRTFHRKLRGVDLCCGDYADSLKTAHRGDLVYIDPPYLRGTDNQKMFANYTGREFREADHEKLAELFHDLDRRGCHVFLSNDDNDEVRALYRGYSMRVLTTRRNINSRAKKRKGWTELLISNRYLPSD